MARHVRKGDMVMVIAGDDRGKVGEVLRVDTKKNRVLVQGVNQVYRHMRPSRQNPQGGRVQKEMPRPVSCSSIPMLDLNHCRSASIKLIIDTGVSKNAAARSVIRSKARSGSLSRMS